MSGSMWLKEKKRLSGCRRSSPTRKRRKGFSAGLVVGISSSSWRHQKSRCDVVDYSANAGGEEEGRPALVDALRRERGHRRRAFLTLSSQPASCSPLSNIGHVLTTLPQLCLAPSPASSDDPSVARLARSRCCRPFPLLLMPPRSDSDDSFGEKYDSRSSRSYKARRDSSDSDLEEGRRSSSDSQSSGPYSSASDSVSWDSTSG